MVLLVFQTVMMAGIVNPDKNQGMMHLLWPWSGFTSRPDCVDFRNVFRKSIGTDPHVNDRDGQVHRERKDSRLCRALRSRLDMNVKDRDGQVHRERKATTMSGFPSRLEQRTHSFRTITSLARFLFLVPISSCLEGCNETFMMGCLNQEPPERLHDFCQW